jgi:hypothetical protein
MLVGKCEPAQTEKKGNPIKSIHVKAAPTASFHEYAKT